MLSHNEYVIWTIENKTLRVAVGICNNVDTPIVYLKDMNAFKEGFYDCYSFYYGAMTMEQAKEIIEAAKIGIIEQFQTLSRNILISTLL